MKFEWDPDKENQNIRKHGVSFSEAVTVFSDDLSLTFYDPDHSVGEDRFLDIGMSARGRLIVISHTDRNDTVRIISARIPTKSERQNYEEGDKFKA